MHHTAEADALTRRQLEALADGWCRDHDEQRIALATPYQKNLFTCHFDHARGADRNVAPLAAVAPPLRVRHRAVIARE